jgi:hypothetical protein
MEQHRNTVDTARYAFSLRQISYHASPDSRPDRPTAGHPRGPAATRLSSAELDNQLDKDRLKIIGTDRLVW